MLTSYLKRLESLKIKFKNSVPENLLLVKTYKLVRRNAIWGQIVIFVRLRLGITLALKDGSVRQLLPVAMILKGQKLLEHLYVLKQPCIKHLHYTVKHTNIFKPHEVISSHNRLISTVGNNITSINMII